MCRRRRASAPTTGKSPTPSASSRRRRAESGRAEAEVFCEILRLGSQGASVTTAVRRDSHCTAARPSNIRARTSDAPAAQTIKAMTGHDGTVGRAVHRLRCGTDRRRGVDWSGDRAAPFVAIADPASG